MITTGPAHAGAYAGKSVVVAGAAGFLGSSLVARLSEIDCEIVRITRRGRALPPAAGAARVRDVHGDVRDRRTWTEAMSAPDVIFHFAAQTSAYVAEADPEADLAQNVTPMLHLLEACRGSGRMPTVVFASTVTVAGVPRAVPLDETHPDRPVTVYDLHKLAAEQYLKCYVDRDHVRGAILRLPNVYGPGAEQGRADRAVLNRMMQRGLRGEPLTIYKPGNRLRDYTYIDDVTDAFLRIPQHLPAVNGRHLLVGTGQGHTVAQAIELVADRIRALTGRPLSVEYVEEPASQLPIEARDSVIDASALRAATGWRPSWALSDGIDRTLDAYARNGVTS